MTEARNAEVAEELKQIEAEAHATTGYGPYKNRPAVDTAACGEHLTADECHTVSRFEDVDVKQSADAVPAPEEA